MEIPEDISDYFLFVIKSLREDELLVMHGHFVPLKERDVAVINYLESEFEKQRIAFSDIELKFDENVAYWAAELIYNSSQLLLNREDIVESLALHLKDYVGQKSRSSIISADLCLRFLPNIIEKLIEMDIEDPLIEKLNLIGREWHYSMISICKSLDQLDFSIWESDRWLLQIYAERAAKFQNKVLMLLPIIDQYYSEELGIYKKQLIK